MLDRVESKGWIVRESTSHDRRIKLLTPLLAGQDVLRQVAPAIRRVQERLLAPLTSSEAKTMIRLLVKMADAGDDERVGPAKGAASSSAFLSLSSMASIRLGPLFAAGLFGLMIGAFAAGPLAARHGRKC